MNKLEIIEQIYTLKKNKHTCENLNDYKNKINLLYKKLSLVINNNYPTKNELKENELKVDKFNLTDDEKISEIIINFMKNKSYQYIVNHPNIKLLSKKFPLFDLFLIENNLLVRDPNIQYEIQIIPIIDNYDKHTFISSISFLLELCMICEKSNKILIVVIMYDYIFRNFKFSLEYTKYKYVVKNKLEEFKQDMDVFNKFLIKYNLDQNIITKWYNTLNQYCNDEQIIK